MRDVIRTQDGGFTLMGTGRRNPYDNRTAILVHLDSDGNNLWNKSIKMKNDFVFGTGDYVTTLTESKSGDYLIFGSTRFDNVTHSFNIAMLMRTDAIGTHLWNKSYMLDYRSSSHALIEDDSNNIVLALTEYDESYGSDFWILCTDYNGIPIWNTTFDCADNEYPVDINLATNDGYDVLGRTNYDAILFHLDSNGIVQWNKTYQYDYSQSVRELMTFEDGSFAFVGSSQTNSTNALAWIMRVNSTGSVIWNGTYGIGAYYGGNSFLEASTDVFIIAGTRTVSFGETTPYDIWIVKVAKPISGLVSEDQTNELGTSFSYDLDANSVLGIDYWYINDTTNFMIDENGLIQNATILSVDFYGVEVFVYDNAGRHSNTTFSITVTDTLPPYWRITPSNQDVEYGGHFQYNVRAVDPSGVHSYWLNDSHFSISSEGSITNTTLLSLGEYPLIVSANDTNDFVLSAEIIVSVEDTTSPLLDELDDVEYEVGTPGFWLNWSATDLLPDNYLIEKNGELIQSDTWNGSDIPFFVESLELGTYNYTIVFIDSSGNLAFDSVIVDAVDTTPPLVDSPLDLWYLHGTGGSLIIWHSSDLYPYSFVIYRDAVQIRTGGWFGESVNIPVDGLEPGVYTFTIEFIDTSGNVGTDSVLVVVEAVSSTVTTTYSTTETTTTTTDETSISPTPSTTETILQQIINNLNNQVSLLTIGLVVVGSLSVLSIVLVIYLIKREAG